MGLISIISKIADVIIDDRNTPESFKKGEAFEKHLEKYLFPPNYYDLIEKTHNYSTNQQRYVEASLKPDFKFRDRFTKREFYIEAKFRTDTYQNKFIWCNEKQLARYQAINRSIPVFLLLADGGKAGLPDGYALIPISKAKYTGLFPSFVDQFAIEIDKPVTSKVLWNR